MGDAHLAALQHADRAAGARACRACGCTDRYACPPGCGWVEADLCSACVPGVDLSLPEPYDAGVELPTYPLLPLVDGRLELEELEAWQLERNRRSAEIAVAFWAIVEGRAPQDDMAAVACRMAEFERRRREDLNWVTGFVTGRFAALLCLDTGLLEQAATTSEYRSGRLAGLMAAAHRLDELGQGRDAETLRSLAAAVVAGP